MTASVKTKPITDGKMKVSSRLAAEWLDKYQGPPPGDPTKPGNRRINDAKVLRFQADMEGHRWLYDGSPIRFSNENPMRILDGQNRLTALANTVPEMELEFLIVTGLERMSQLVMDQPEVRTVGQNLHLMGVKNSSTAGAAAKFYLDWTRGRLFKSTTRGCTTKPETQEWVLNHPELLERLFATPFVKVDAPVSVTGAFALATLQFAPARTDRFLHQLAMGVNLQEGDPVLALDRRLRNIRRTGVKVSQREYLAYFIKAWNAWSAGTPLQKIQLGRLTEDSFPGLLQVGDFVQ
jgi:hypothetical protein